MAEKKTSPAAVEISPEQIAAWKKQYGKVYRVEVDGKIGYVRRPTRQIIGMAGVIGGNDTVALTEVLIKNCWLGGDSELKTEDKYVLGFVGKFDEIIEIAKVELKEV